MSSDSATPAPAAKDAPEKRPPSEFDFESEGLYVDESQRRSWGSIAMIWVGNSFNVSSLLTGATLGVGLTMMDSFWAAFIGTGILVAYMCFMAMEGSDTGLPTSAMSTAALGKGGGRILVSLVMALSLIGWFGVQAAVCGSSFSVMMGEFMGIDIPVWVSATVLGALMLITAVVGFDGVKWVNYIAAPLLIIVCVYGLGVSISGTGWDSVFNYVPPEAMTMVSGISICVGLFAVGAAGPSDFTRYAKDRKGSVLSSVVGLWIPMTVSIMIGVLLSIVDPASGGDVTLILAGMGLAVVALIALVLSTWTVNVGNAYSGGLALAVLFGRDESGYKVLTAVAGIAGIILADLGIMDYFTQFLTFLSAMVPALAGSVIADYWIIRKGRPANFKPLPGWSVPGVVSFLVGALFAMVTGGTFVGTPLEFLDFEIGLGPVNGILLAMLLYVIIYKAMKLPAFEGKVAWTTKQAKGSE